MRLVDRPAFAPHHCAAIPYIGPASHPQERWVDAGAELPGLDNHVYLSETAVREAAALLADAPPYSGPAAYTPEVQSVPEPAPPEPEPKPAPPEPPVSAAVARRAHARLLPGAPRPRT